MKQIYLILNELIKSYHIFSRFDEAKARELLKKINEYRLQIALNAEQRQIFYDQLTAEANASGYRNDLTFTRDDAASVVVRMIASLEQDVKIALTQLGTRELFFTRQSVGWQQVFSSVQSSAPPVGQLIPFDFPQEIFLDKNQALSIGVTGQSAASGYIFVHGANIKDDYSPRREDIDAEIKELNLDGKPQLPKMQLIPIQFKFSGGAADDPAIATDGANVIYSVKSDRSVILTDVSTDSLNSRISLLDTGRNQEICTDVESQGVAGFATNQYANFYPLPYPHLLQRQGRLKFSALNGSDITGNPDAVDTIFTVCFRGFTI